MAEIKIWFEGGSSLPESLYVAAAVDQKGQLRADVEPVVVRASHVLNPALVEALNRIAASEGTAAEKKAQADKLPVQPERYLALFQATCKTLEEFKSLALNLAANKGDLERTAVEVGKEPMMATEPRDKVKMGEEPKVAAEAGLRADAKGKGESAPAFKQLMGQMPSKVGLGTPERAVDLHSSQDPALVVIAEQLEGWKKRAEEAEAALGQQKKEQELGGVMTLLTELGALEDAKDKEKFSKMLGGLEDKALGVVETLLKAVRDSKAKPAAGAGHKPPSPVGGGAGKPPSPVGGGGPKPPSAGPMGGGMPEMKSSQNVVFASQDDRPALSPASVGGNNGASDLTKFWVNDNNRRPVGR
jgi:hypothetical protein